MTAPKKSKTVTLSDPIEWDGERITEVTITNPKVKHLRRIEEAVSASPNRMDQGVAMAVAMTGLAGDIIDEMDVDDFNAISEVIAGFFPQDTASQTGEVSLQKPPTGSIRR